MATNFSSLRSARKTALDKLNEEIKKEQSKQGADERLWKLSVDQKNKIGYASLRFLPAPKGEDVPWVRLWTHGFKLNGAWYIENCPTTLNRLCPVCKQNNVLWNSGIDADKEIARERKRKLSFISNILMLEDHAHPENNGKVFLYRYGSKIHDKIQELINPKFPDQQPTNPFDLWEGCDFKLKSQQVGGFQNYDKSEFSDASPITYAKGTDADLEELWGKQYSLQAFIADDQFKSFDELERRFNRVATGEVGPRSAVEAIKAEQPTAEDAANLADAAESNTAAPVAPRRTRKATVTPQPVIDVKPVDAVEDAPEGEDDIKSFFAGVLND
jgi:hypothetical protein